MPALDRTGYGYEDRVWASYGRQWPRALPTTRSRTQLPETTCPERLITLSLSKTARDESPFSLSNLGFGFEVSDFGFQIKGFGIRISSFGVHVSGFGFGLGFRV